MKANIDISWFELDRIIESAEAILLTTHVNPDGDGIGCEAAFYHHLRKLGKTVRIINASPLPYQYDFLNDGGIVEQFSGQNRQWIENCDLALIFDVGDPKRILDIGDLIYGKMTTICIDHHASSSTDIYSYNIIDPDAASTGSLVWDYLRHVNNGRLLPLAIAEALYTAIVTDTGSFRYNNTNTHAHEMSIHLIESGVSPSKIHQEIFERRKLIQVRLLGEIIRGLMFAHDNQTVFFRVTRSLLKSLGAGDEDVDGYTDFVRSIDGVEIAFMLMEMEDRVRINFRSKGQYSVNDIAMKFGGGGHKFAAGATVLNGRIPEIEQEILTLIEHKLNGSAV